MDSNLIYNDGPDLELPQSITDSYKDDHVVPSSPRVPRKSKSKSLEEKKSVGELSSVGRGSSIHWSSMDSFGDDEFRKLTYYEGIYCDSCRKMAKTEMKEEYDDDDYVFEDDDFGGDNMLKLRMIHYRRNVAVNGPFYADCPPSYPSVGLLPHSRYHFKNEPDFEETVEDCADFAIEKYNEKMVPRLELRGIENVSCEGFARRRLYMILRCCNIGSSGDGSPDDDGKQKRSSEVSDGIEKTYRVVVSCCWWRKLYKEVLVFKDSDGNNLLVPNRSFDERTKTENRRPPPTEQDA